MLFHRSQRFAHPGSEFRAIWLREFRTSSLPCRLDLLLIQNVSRVAVPCAQAQHILASKTCDRAFQDSALAVRSQICCAISGVSRASFGCPIRASVCWTFRSEIRARTAIVEAPPTVPGAACRQTPDRRSCCEVREDNGVLLGQLGSRRGIATRKRPGRHAAQQEEDESRGCAEERPACACGETCAFGTACPAARPARAGAPGASGYRLRGQTPKRSAARAPSPVPSCVIEFRSPSTRRRSESRVGLAARGNVGRRRAHRGELSGERAALRLRG